MADAGWGAALQNIGGSLMSFGMDRLQQKQQMDAESKRKQQEEQAWQERMRFMARLGAPEERVRQVWDEQMNKAVAIREQWQPGDENATGKWAEQGRDIVPPKQTTPEFREFQQGTETVSGLLDPASGSFQELGRGPKFDPRRQTMGGGGVSRSPKAPSGYRWTPEGALAPIPGGPADKPKEQEKPTKIPADIAGRVALTDEFLANGPEIRKKIQEGSATGPLDTFMGRRGRGESGDLLRKIQSGRDALQRSLTGAGMPASEADEYANRYLPTYTDDVETLTQKFDQLSSELTRYRDILTSGHATPSPAAVEKSASGLPAIGTVQDGYRFKGGNPADPNSWEPI